MKISAIDSNIPDPLIVQDLAGDSVDIVQSEKSAYIFVGGYSCKECITVLEQAILECDSTYTIHVILRITPGTRVFSKKAEIQRVGKLVETRSFYFDVGASAGLGKYEDGLFEYFEVSATPTVLLNFPERHPEFIGYSELFGRTEDLAANDKDSSRCTRVIAKFLEIQ